MPRDVRNNSTAPTLWTDGREAHEEREEQASLFPVTDNSENMAAAPAEIWKSNPLQGDFNPGTKLGKDIFLEKSKGLPENERFDLSRSNETSICQYLQARENHMEGCLDIPTEFNNDGTVKVTKHLLTQYHSIRLEDCQRAAHEHYGEKLDPEGAIPAAPFEAKNLDPANNEDDKKQFFKKVCSNVVAKIVENGLSRSGYADLMLQKNSFLFKNETTKEIELDGPTMIYLCFTAVDPDTVVGLNAIEEKLKNAKLEDFGNNVSKMLTNMETNYKILKDNGEAPSKYRKILLDALLTGPNHTFNQFVQRMIDDTESGMVRWPIFCQMKLSRRVVLSTTIWKRRSYGIR